MEDPTEQKDILGCRDNAACRDFTVCNLEALEKTREQQEQEIIQTQPREERAEHMAKKRKFSFSEFEQLYDQIIKETVIETKDGGGTFFNYCIDDPGEMTEEQKEIYNQHLNRLEQLAEENKKNPPQEFEDVIKLFFEQGNVFFDMLIIKAPELNTEEKRKAFVNGFAYHILSKTISKDAKAKKPAFKDIERIKFPLDIVNNNIWDIFNFNNKQIPGQQSLFELKYDTRSEEEKRIAKKTGEEEEGDLLRISVDFTALEESGLNINYTRNIDEYDKNICMHVASLYAAGNTEITARELYRAMHKKGEKVKASQDQIQKLAERILKMRYTDIVIDNQKEVEKYGHDKPEYLEYRIPLLPCVVAFDRATKHNKKNKEHAITNFKITVNEMPPLIEFAAERKEITTTRRNVLAIPMSYTPENLKIRDYILQRIKRHGFNGSIYLDTLFNACHIERRDARHRAIKKINTILEHFKTEGEIKNYEIKDGIIKIQGKG